MTGRILVVDAVPTNRIILRVKLAAAFYEVVQAASGHAAIAMIRKVRPDLILTACDLPDMSGRALCSAVQKSQIGQRIPIVIIHGDECAEERLASLGAGADDVLTRPIDDIVMLARLRSLLRARDAEAELQLRGDTRRALGLDYDAQALQETPGLVNLIPIGDFPGIGRLQEQLRVQTGHQVTLLDPENALREAGAAPDVIIIAEGRNSRAAGLTLLPQLRSASLMRHASIIYMAPPHQRREAANALDLGANDLLTGPPDPIEIAIRLKKQIARKRTADKLRADLHDGLRAAVADHLTGLHNRRYALPHIQRVAERAAGARRPYALLMADLDHFKQVNDQYGHAAGDAVLVALADRMRDNLRAADLMARWGGEEFLVAMPDTDMTAAKATAERLCKVMADRPVLLPDGQTVTVTLSVGVAVSRLNEPGGPVELIEQADRALYQAKHQGRNRVGLADRVIPLHRRKHRPTPPPPVQAAADLSQTTSL